MKVPPENDWMITKCISEALSSSKMPKSIPNGLAHTKSTKIILVSQESSFWLFDRNVVPRVQATGILWMITLMAKTVISPSWLKTPMAIPSIKLWKTRATPKVAMVTLSTLYTYSGSSFWPVFRISSVWDWSAALVSRLLTLLFLLSFSIILVYVWSAFSDMEFSLSPPSICKGGSFLGL